MYHVLCIMYHVLCIMYYVLCIMYYVLYIIYIYYLVDDMISYLMIAAADAAAETGSTNGKPKLFQGF